MRPDEGPQHVPPMKAQLERREQTTEHRLGSSQFGSQEIQEHVERLGAGCNKSNSAEISARLSSKTDEI
eukprot:634875-Pyramimonas_sp.AAC.1